MTTFLPLNPILVKSLLGSLFIYTILSTVIVDQILPKTIEKYLSRREYSARLTAPESLSVLKNIMYFYFVFNRRDFTSAKQYISLNKLLSIITNGDLDFMACRNWVVLN